MVPSRQRYQCQPSGYDDNGQKPRLEIFLFMEKEDGVEDNQERAGSFDGDHIGNQDKLDRKHLCEHAGGSEDSYAQELKPPASKLLQGRI